MSALVYCLVLVGCVSALCVFDTVTADAQSNTATACASLEMDAATLDRLCHDNSSPTASSPACSLQRICRTSEGPSTVTGQICNTDRLFASVCRDNPELLECSEYANAFLSEAEYASCLAGLSVAIYNTSEVRSAVLAGCSGGVGVPGCNRCSATSCPDPLGALSLLCLSASPPAAQCAQLTAWCEAEQPTNAAVLCLSPSQRPTSDACLQDPTPSSCANYTYSLDAATRDVAALCTAMPDMPACSIWAACNAKVMNSRKYCRPFQLLATICADMPTQLGCSVYNNMCQVGSQLKQCSQLPAIPGTPTWYSARSDVFGSCNSHYMTGCTECTSAKCPDPLNTLAVVCNQMPEMDTCAGYEAWCDSVGADMAYFCHGSRRFLPSMLMYFHSRVEEIVLFRSWWPRTQGQFAATFFAILLFGIASVGLSTWRSCLIARWAHHAAAAEHAAVAGRSIWAFTSREQFVQSVVKSVLSGAAHVFDLFLMLIVMTFNSGLFVAVVLSYILGGLLFSHVTDNYTAALASAEAPSAFTRFNSEASAGAEEEGGKYHPSGAEGNNKARSSEMSYQIKAPLYLPREQDL